MSSARFRPVRLAFTLLLLFSPLLLVVVVVAVVLLLLLLLGSWGVCGEGGGLFHDAWLLKLLILGEFAR